MKTCVSRECESWVDGSHGRTLCASCVARMTQAGETLRLRGIVQPVMYSGRVRGSSAGSPADTALASRPQEGE